MNSDNLELKDLYDSFRDANTIKGYAKLISNEAKKFNETFYVMEVCGGHTHTMMKYALLQLLPKHIKFIHGPGCPVCVMPRVRVDHAYALASCSDTIIVTLGDMIKVLGTHGSLQDARAKGADVRFVYSPMDTLEIAKQNPNKKVIFFAIGFETTTPMSAALLNATIRQKIDNLFFHINHITVPEVMLALAADDNSKIDAFIAPSHVSVISGSKIYEPLVTQYKMPIVVSGFEPVDMMQSLLMLLKQKNSNQPKLEIQYKRAVSYEGNLIAQALVDKFFIKSTFTWRGIGAVANSGLKLKDEFAHYDAEIIFKDKLPSKAAKENKLCLCSDILKGVAQPLQCTLFATTCKPSFPIGSCMVSSEGACAAYYKYGNISYE